MNANATTERTVAYLLVEDNDDHADIIERCIGHGDLPNTLHRVNSGAKCLDYLAGEPPFADRDEYPYPNVVFLDIRMPGLLDGLQTLQAIRADQRHRCLPVMMLTTSDRDTDIKRAYELGANGYIVKSEDTSDLTEKLLQIQRTYHSVVRLPERGRESDHAASSDNERPSRHSGDAQSLLNVELDAAVDVLVSTYRKDRDEILRLFKSLESISPIRFALLLQRFCVENRQLFAGGQNVDWEFLQHVVMETLPQYTVPEKIGGILAGITATLECNKSVNRDNPSWLVWQGFCQAYSNRKPCTLSEPTEPTEQPPHAILQSLLFWKVIAIGAIIFALIGAIVHLRAIAP